MAGKLESEERNIEQPTPAVWKRAPPFWLSCGGVAGSRSSCSEVDCPSLTSGSYHQNRDTSTDMHVDGGAQSQVRTGRTESPTGSVWHSEHKVY